MPGQGLAPVGTANVAQRAIPTTRLVGRHLSWPAAIRKSRPDVYFGPAGQLPLGDVGAPAVITIHDLAIYLHREWFPGRQPLSTGLVVPRSVERAARVLCVSANTARDVEAIFHTDPGKLEVVHEGVSPRFRPLEPDQTLTVRERLGLPARFILFVSTVEPRKNLETLLDAWAQLADRPPLVVAGAFGWRFQAVAAKMERLAGAGLHHLGPVAPEDLPALYNAALCLAHPAWYEGFGLTPLEAMACATPVVCSSSSSLPEVVGDAGILVDPGDVGAWHEALRRVVGDGGLRNELARRGVLRAADFSWERAADRTWRALSRAAAG
jgi:glycosyltransferase involved in cell wall biosynthesis